MVGIGFEGLKALAPVDLFSHREERYDGGGFELERGDLAAEDIERLERIYGKLRQIYDLWLYMRDAPNYGLLHGPFKALREGDFFEDLRQLGAATQARAAGPLTARQRQALHDLRGGALTALLGYASLMEPEFSADPTQLEYMQRLVYLARDHAKMMRNLLPFLDPLLREADESNQLHLVQGFVEKWQGFTWQRDKSPGVVRVNATTTGYLTSRCLETSAVDRILYNFLNNAMRFASTPEISLEIFFAHPQLLRWVVLNQVDDVQRDWLRRELPQEQGLRALFRGGFTRGGHGIGLSGCAELLGVCFGVGAEDAIDRGYLGAQLIGDTFAAWFHWPACPESLGEPCPCSRTRGFDNLHRKPIYGHNRKPKGEER